MPTDEEIRAEVQTILGNSGETTADAVTTIDPVATDTPPGAPPAAAAAPPPVPANVQLDEQTSRKIAVARRAQEQAANERRALAAERQARQAELAKVQEFQAALERAKVNGDIGGVLRSLGIQPDRNHAEALLTEALDKDAPPELRTQVQLAQLRREQESLRAEQQRFRAEQQQAEQQRQAIAYQAQQRAYVRDTLIPQHGDQAAALRALAMDPEFGEGVVQSYLQQYQAMAQAGEAPDPIETSKIMHSRLVRMATMLMKDSVVAAEVQKALGIAPSPKPQPKTIPAEKSQPAPTIDRSLSSKTPPAAPDDWGAYLEQVRREVAEKLKGA